MHLRQHLPPASKRFAIDIGGTFTDLVILDDQGDLRMAKAPSTPLDPSAGVIRAALKAHLTLSAPEFFIHGTTLGINTLLQRRSAFSPEDRVVLDTTGGAGYGDPLEREPASVASDVLNDFVSREDARKLYGVSIGDSGEVDRDATIRLREELKRPRTGGELSAFCVCLQSS